MNMNVQSVSSFDPKYYKKVNVVNKVLQKNNNNGFDKGKTYMFYYAGKDSSSIITTISYEEDVHVNDYLKIVETAISII